MKYNARRAPRPTRPTPRPSTVTAYYDPATYRKGLPIQLRATGLTLAPKVEGQPHGWYHSETQHWVDARTGLRPLPGSIFYKPEQFQYPIHESSRFRASARAPIFVVLPDGSAFGYWWCIDELSSKEVVQVSKGQKLPEPNGWNVIIPKDGNLERITIQPSIKTSHYHAVITNGIMHPCGDSLV